MPAPSRLTKITAKNQNFQGDVDSKSFNLHYKSRTREEYLKPILYSEATDGACKKINESGLDITHVLTGITYGGKLDIEFEEVKR